MRNAIFILFLSQMCFSQTRNEQIATDYFFETIVEKENLNFRKINFSGFTEKQTSGLLHSADCLSIDENNDIQTNGYKETAERLKIETGKKSGGGKFKFSMSVYKSSKLVSGKEVVVISLVRKNQSIWNYVIILEDSKVINWCPIYALI